MGGGGADRNEAVLGQRCDCHQDRVARASRQHQSPRALQRWPIRHQSQRFFADFNSSKLSVSVDINHPRAVEVVLPLVQWADIVADSFRPGVLEQRGFGYEKLS